MYDIYNVECITPKKEFLSSTQALVIQIDNSSIIIHCTSEKNCARPSFKMHKRYDVIHYDKWGREL